MGSRAALEQPGKALRVQLCAHSYGAGSRRACRGRLCRAAARPGPAGRGQLRVRPAPGVLTAPGRCSGQRPCEPPQAAVWRVEQGEAGAGAGAAPQLQHPGDVASALAAVCQVEAASTHVVGAAHTVVQGLDVLRQALGAHTHGAQPFGSGVLRLEVHLPRGIQAVQWLRGLPQEVRLRIPVTPPGGRRLTLTPVRPPPAVHGCSAAGVLRPSSPASSAGRGCSRRVVGCAARGWAGRLSAGGGGGGWRSSPVAGRPGDGIRRHGSCPCASLRFHRGASDQGAGGHPV